LQILSWWEWYRPAVRNVRGQSCVNCFSMHLMAEYGIFIKYGYPQMIHFNRIFYYKSPSYWCTAIPMETSNGRLNTSPSDLQDLRSPVLDVVTWRTLSRGQIRQQMLKGKVD
jgi:hypothetical protein